MDIHVPELVSGLTAAVGGVLAGAATLFGQRSEPSLRNASSCGKSAGATHFWLNRPAFSSRGADAPAFLAAMDLVLTCPERSQSDEELHSYSSVSGVNAAVLDASFTVVDPARVPHTHAIAAAAAADTDNGDEPFLRVLAVRRYSRTRCEREQSQLRRAMHQTRRTNTRRLARRCILPSSRRVAFIQSLCGVSPVAELHARWQDFR